MITSKFNNDWHSILSDVIIFSVIIKECNLPSNNSLFSSAPRSDDSCLTSCLDDSPPSLTSSSISRKPVSIKNPFYWFLNSSAVSPSWTHDEQRLSQGSLHQPQEPSQASRSEQDTCSSLRRVVSGEAVAHDEARQRVYAVLPEQDAKWPSSWPRVLLQHFEHVPGWVPPTVDQSCSEATPQRRRKFQSTWNHRDLRGVLASTAKYPLHLL